MLRGLLPPFGVRRCSSTALGNFLRERGADRISIAEVSNVEAAEDSNRFSWRVTLPYGGAGSFRRGDAIDSPSFRVNSRSRARIQFFPAGDSSCDQEGMCSLWVWSDGPGVRPHSLRVGNVERPGGATDFCRLDEVLQNDHVLIEMEVREDNADSMTSVAHQPRTSGGQSLHMTELQQAEWRIHGLQHFDCAKAIESPPFRMHHVLLGDMYLEVHPNTPHEQFGTIFFRCRVPTMVLQVQICAGAAFSKTIMARGRSTHAEDVTAGECLVVNFRAPDVFDSKGDLCITAKLEEVVSLPKELHQMIPQLNERALWPKRL